jgi:hypothetical protein
MIHNPNRLTAAALIAAVGATTTIFPAAAIDFDWILGTDGNWICQQPPALQNVACEILRRRGRKHAPR